MKTRIAVVAASPGPAVAAGVVDLAAGPCFGQSGQIAHLAAKGPWGWGRVLPKPGTTHAAVIEVLQASTCN